ncbi:MAG: CAP domain-containing protein [Deltaproteobacteria bacterium]|nr:CAP domain-containing protein [Deltaproteobacteria bacterium]
MTRSGSRLQLPASVHVPPAASRRCGEPATLAWRIFAPISASLRGLTAVFAVAAIASGCSDAAHSGGATSVADAGGDSSGPQVGLGELTAAVKDGQLTLGWPEDEWPIHCLVFRQAKGTKQAETVLCSKETGQRSVTVGPEAGKNGADYAWTATKDFGEGTATWELRGGNTWGSTPHTVAKGTAVLGPRFDGPCSTPTTKATGLEQWHPKGPVKLDISVQLGEAARSEVDFSTPEIWVDTVAAKGSPSPGGTISFSYTFDTPGMYTVEVNNTAGGAILNCAVYVGGALPFVSVSVTGGPGLQADPDATQLAAYRQKLLELTNAERQKVGRPPLKLEDKLNQMAQYHSQDMGAKGYFGHDSPTGESVGDRAKKFGWTKAVGENIASSGSIAGAHNGLYWSAAHRANMLSTWSVVGFGIAKDGKGTNMLVTENFGE